LAGVLAVLKSVVWHFSEGLDGLVKFFLSLSK